MFWGEAVSLLIWFVFWVGRAVGGPVPLGGAAVGNARGNGLGVQPKARVFACLAGAVEAVEDTLCGPADLGGSVAGLIS